MELRVYEVKYKVLYSLGLEHYNIHIVVLYIL